VGEFERFLSMARQKCERLDLCDGSLAGQWRKVLMRGRKGEIYNISANEENPNSLSPRAFLDMLGMGGGSD